MLLHFSAFFIFRSRVSGAGRAGLGNLRKTREFHAGIIKRMGPRRVKFTRKAKLATREIQSSATREFHAAILRGSEFHPNFIAERVKIVNYTAYFDGACSGNPGPMSIGFVINDPSGTTIKEYSKSIGEGTNNIAEYQALIVLMQNLRDQEITDVQIYGDSQLVVNQVNMKWQINHDHLRRLAAKVWKLMEDHPGWDVQWVRREMNPADAVAKNRVLYSSSIPA